ncbi:DNA-binding barrel domain superfamily [Sesbania bispinosa]|nr:DNA-binding barrel domain superfamily [Sesbania bispinosa]
MVFLLPPLVHPTGTSSVGEHDIVNVNSENPNENPEGIVNRTGPHNALVGKIGMRRVKQTLPHNAAAGRRVMSFQNQSGRVTAVACRRVMSFEKVITKSQSKGRQTLPIPRKFVQDFIRRDWSELILKVRRGQHYNCKLVRRNGRGKDCHPWQTLVQETKEIIKISTSNHRDIHQEYFGEAASISPDPNASFLKELNMDEKVSKSSNNKDDTAQNQPQNNNDNEDMSVNVSQFGTSVEHLTNVVSGLTTVLINHSPAIAAALKTVQGIPLSVNNTKTPNTMDHLTPETVNQLDLLTTKLIKSNLQKNERNLEGSLKKKLFTPNNNGSTSAFHISLCMVIVLS